MWRCCERLPNVPVSFLKYLMTARQRAIIWEMGETAFALNLLETGGIGGIEVCGEGKYSMLSTDLSSSARSYVDAHKQRMLRPVPEVADVETRLVPAGRPLCGFSSGSGYS